MKLILLFLATFLFLLTNARSEVVHCRTEQGKYMLVLKQTRGALFASENGTYRHRKGELEVFREEDDSITAVSFRPHEGEQQWNGKECFKWLDPFLVFRFAEKSFQFLPNIRLRPDVPDCPVPQVAVMAPKPMTCKFLR